MFALVLPGEALKFPRATKPEYPSTGGIAPHPLNEQQMTGPDSDRRAAFPGANEAQQSGPRAGAFSCGPTALQLSGVRVPGPQARGGHRACPRPCTAKGPCASGLGPRTGKPRDRADVRSNCWLDPQSPFVPRFLRFTLLSMRWGARGPRPGTVHRILAARRAAALLHQDGSWPKMSELRERSTVGTAFPSREDRRQRGAYPFGELAWTHSRGNEAPSLRTRRGPCRAGSRISHRPRLQGP